MGKHMKDTQNITLYIKDLSILLYAIFTKILKREEKSNIHYSYSNGAYILD